MKDSSDFGKKTNLSDTTNKGNPLDPINRELDSGRTTVQIFKDIMENVDIAVAQSGSPMLRKKLKTRLKADIGFIACMLKSYEDRYGK